MWAAELLSAIELLWGAGVSLGIVSVIPLNRPQKVVIEYRVFGCTCSSCQNSEKPEGPVHWWVVGGCEWML